MELLPGIKKQINKQVSIYLPEILYSGGNSVLFKLQILSISSGQAGAYFDLQSVIKR
jgi:hypothetical protein